MSLKFRRVQKVTDDSANLAYVAVPSIPAASLVDILDPSGTAGVEKRAIMYADLAGRLVALNGDPSIQSAYPVVTDLFYDKNGNHLLDSSEVVPEAALPYRYRSQRTYYGKAQYPASGGITEVTTYTTPDWNTTLNDEALTVVVTNVTADNVGRYIKLTEAQHDNVEIPYFKSVYRKITAVNEGTDTISYESAFMEESAGVTGGWLSDVKFEIVEIGELDAPLFSLVGNEGIRLVDENGAEYTGRYMLLIQRAAEETVVVATDGPEAGWACSWVHVFIDRDDQDVYLEFPAASIALVNSEYQRIGDIDTSHRERVEAYEMFRYASLADATNPVNEGHEICASVPYGDLHSIFVPDRAFIDSRIIDPLLWRVNVAITRSTPVKSATGVDDLKVGVIGDVTDELSQFLHYDPTYAFRMRCRNPYPMAEQGLDHWRINEASANWADYDIVIYRTSNVSWTKYNAIAARIIEAGGIFLIDAASALPTVDAELLQADREKTVPIQMKIGSTFTEIADPSAITDIGAVSWLENTEGGYDLSSIDYASITPNVPFAYIDYAAAANPERVSLLYGTVAGNTRCFIAELRKGLIFSTISLSDMQNEALKQLFCNIVWGYGAADASRTISTAQYVMNFSSPWQTSWVAGRNTAGDPILSQAEMDEFGFYIVKDEESHDNRIVRKLSEKTAAQIIAEYLVSSGNERYINGADYVSYTLELAGHDRAMVDYYETLTAASFPVAWSKRSDSAVFNPPSGYLIKSYLEEPLAGVMPAPPGDTVATVRVVGTLVSLEENEFTWSFAEGFSYETRVAVEREVPITKDSGYVKFVTTWSDRTWTAPNVLQYHDVRHDANLLNWGSQTAVKYYPWDGQSFLATLNHNHGPYVTYVQQALNALVDVGRGHRTGKLQVTGTYDRKTDAAVRDYQKRWGLTVDGDVDAGTAGHIMRNAGSTTGWSKLNEIWASYGDMFNIVDGNPHSVSGRRTWINANVGRMTDSIDIHLHSGMKISAVEITPYMIGGGAALYLDIYRIGGRRAANGAVYDWAFDRGANTNDAWSIYHRQTGSMRLSLPNELDVLSVGLFQDTNYEGRSKQWGVSDVIFYGLVTTSQTVTKWGSSRHNAALEINTASHNALAKTTTITTKLPHSLKKGDVVYVSGLAETSANGKFTITAIPAVDQFVYTSAASQDSTENNTGTTVRYIAETLRTGERKTVRIVPGLPGGATFKGWNKTAAEMATAIRDSILPTTEQKDVAVDVSIDATTGVVSITFFSPLETADKEVSKGRPLTITQRRTELYGIDNDTETGTVSATTQHTVKDASKYWAPSYAVGKTITFTTGAMTGKSYLVTAQNADGQTLTLDDSYDGTILAPAQNDRFVLSGGICHRGYITGTCGNDCTATSISSDLSGMGTNALAGALLLFTSGVNDKRVVEIESNTATVITLKPVPSSSRPELPAISNPVNGTTFKIITGHWPVFDTREEDEAYAITYRVDPLEMTSPVVGLFVVLDETGNVTDVLESITYNELVKYGFDKVKIAISSLRTVGDPSLGSIDRFPVRYAMKPFCVIEKTHDCDFDVKGLSGDQPSEMWGLKIEAGSAKRSVLVPDGLCVMADGRNNLLGYETLVKDAIGKNVECIYSVTSGHYSSTYGAPYLDVVDEQCLILEYDAETRRGRASVSMAPIHLDANGSPLLSIEIDNLGEGTSISITDVDINTGVFGFYTTKMDFSPESNAINADYTYREIYVEYAGAAVAEPGVHDIFDLCPYAGHVMTIDGAFKDVSDLIGTPIYVYALPKTVKVDETIVSSTRSVYHTTFGDMFDNNSPFYNPFALLIAIVTIRNSGDIAETVVIDTRTGGGGIAEGHEALLRDERYRHPAGFYEVDGFFDIGHMDGSGYLIGGTVVIKLPLAWRTEWTDTYGMTATEVDSMVAKFCHRWVPAGKSWLVVWNDENQDIMIGSADVDPITD